MYPYGDQRDAVGYPLSPPIFGPQGFGQYGAPLVVRPPYGWFGYPFGLPMPYVVAGAPSAPGHYATGYMPMAVLVPWDLWDLYGGPP
jgi:hypothetical protein